MQQRLEPEPRRNAQPYRSRQRLPPCSLRRILLRCLAAAARRGLATYTVLIRSPSVAAVAAVADINLFVEARLLRWLRSAGAVPVGLATTCVRFKFLTPEEGLRVLSMAPPAKGVAERSAGVREGATGGPPYAFRSTRQ